MAFLQGALDQVSAFLAGTNTDFTDFTTDFTFAETPFVETPCTSNTPLYTPYAPVATTTPVEEATTTVSVFTTIFTTVMSTACSTGAWDVTYTITDTYTGQPGGYPTGTMPPGFITTTVTATPCSDCEPTPIEFTCPEDVQTETTSAPQGSTVVATSVATVTVCDACEEQGGGQTGYITTTYDTNAPATPTSTPSPETTPEQVYTTAPEPSVIDTTTPAQVYTTAPEPSVINTTPEPISTGPNTPIPIQQSYTTAPFPSVAETSTPSPPFSPSSFSPIPVMATTTRQQYYGHNNQTVATPQPQPPSSPSAPVAFGGGSSLLSATNMGLFVAFFMVAQVFQLV